MYIFGRTEVSGILLELSLRQVAIRMQPPPSAAAFGPGCGGGAGGRVVGGGVKACAKAPGIHKPRKSEAFEEPAEGPANQEQHGVGCQGPVMLEPLQQHPGPHLQASNNEAHHTNSTINKLNDTRFQCKGLRTAARRSLIDHLLLLREQRDC